MKGDGDMTRTWAKSRLDMDILGKLYDYKSMRGTTLAKLCTPYDLQMTFDRIYALGKLEKIESKTYMEQEGPTGRNKINGFKKKGQMYYLTGEGVKALREYRRLPVREYESEVIKAVATLKNQVTELLQPENGYTHKVNGELCIINDLIGFSPKAMRQITSSLNEGKKKYIVVEKMTQLPLIVRHFPELLNPAHEFITLDGACETSEGIKKEYSRKRNQTRSI